MTTLRLNNAQDDTDSGDAEAQMRRALRVGMPHGAQHGTSERDHADQRRRHGQSADVAVTRLAPRRDHPAVAALAAAEDALRAERTLREAAEAAAAAAQGAIQALKTKLAHTEMALADMVEAGERRQAAEAKAVEDAEPSRGPMRAARERKLPEPDAAEAADMNGAEPEPVQWWLPDWRATRR